jgi:hypothetical protein
MIGALLALLIMLAVFTVQFLMDDTFKYAEDIEKEFGVMPLTVIPEGKIEGLEASDAKISRRSRYYNKTRKKSKSKGK